MSSSLARETQWYSVSKDYSDKIKMRVVKVSIKYTVFQQLQWCCCCWRQSQAGDQADLELVEGLQFRV